MTLSVLDFIILDKTFALGQFYNRETIGDVELLLNIYGESLCLHGGAYALNRLFL